MAIENMVVEYLLSGQFWAANFFALVATIYWSFGGTGAPRGNLRHQVVYCRSEPLIHSSLPHVTDSNYQPFWPVVYHNDRDEYYR